LSPDCFFGEAAGLFLLALMLTLIEDFKNLSDHPQ